MAVELATGYISLVPSARGFARNLSREIGGPLETAGTDAGDKAARGFGRTFVAGVGAAATRGAVAVGAGFTLAAGVGIKIAADFEQTTIAFEGILGSADEAKTVLGDLRDFAAKTPFEFTGLTESAQQLLGLGFATDDIIPLMGTLGDVAAALGAGEPEIKGVVRALGQIKGKGKVSAEELQQISEQLPGFSAINAIAEDLGVTTAEAFELMAKGAIPADEGIAAILKGMEKFPGSAGAMERQSKTLNGVISTFKDTLSTTAIDFITPYLPAISQGVSSFGGFIQNTAIPAVEGFISFISDTVIPGVQNLLDIFREDGIRGVFDAISRFIEEHGPQIGEKLLAWGQALVDWVAPQIPPLLSKLLDLIGSIGTWAVEEGLPALVTAMLALVPAVVGWLTDPEDGGIVKLVEALPGIIDGLEDWVENEAMPAFKDAGIEIAGALAEGFVQGLRDSLKGPPGAEFHIPGTDIDIPLPFGTRARGGPVRRNTPYVVGDGGRPELFIPTQSGTILPELPAFGSAGAGTVNDITIYYPVPESEEDGVLRALRRAAAEAA